MDNKNRFQALLINQLLMRTRWKLLMVGQCRLSLLQLAPQFRVLDREIQVRYDKLVVRNALQVRLVVKTDAMSTSQQPGPD